MSITYLKKTSRRAETGQADVRTTVQSMLDELEAGGNKIVRRFMDALANILILTLLLVPLVTKPGTHPVHFGIVMITCASMGFLTSPAGVNLFVGCSIGIISIEKLSIAGLSFLLALLLALLFISIIPAVALWLPGLSCRI